MKTVTITTVGTSCIINTRNRYPHLFPLLENGDYQAMANELLEMKDGQLRKVSAEVNSIMTMMESGIIKGERLFLILSDTLNGQRAGALLKEVFTAAETLISFKYVETVCIDGLNDEDFEVFRHTGLKNLVSRMCSIILGYQDDVVINNTGGYKAEIAYAGMIGQLFGIPVYYQHEKFGSMIELPPLPVSFDFTVLERHSKLFCNLVDNGEIRADNIDGFSDPVLRYLVDTVTRNDEEWISLNAAGHLFVKASSHNNSGIK